MGSMHICLFIIPALCATAYAWSKSPMLVYAHCKVGGPTGIMGSVDLRQGAYGGPLQIKVNLTGFDTNDQNLEHSMHIHTYGDLLHPCTQLGSHFNPLNTPHGAPTNNMFKRHVGDLGNVPEDAEGASQTIFKDNLASLVGTVSIIGRSVAFHQTPDTFGLAPPAPAPPGAHVGPVACCVIGWADSSHWGKADGPYM